MTSPIQLLQLKCIHCQTPLSANEEEVAWLCAQCGKGTQLTSSDLAPVKLVWVASRPNVTTARWHPFWVFVGKVNFTRRETYDGGEEPNPLWNSPARFYIPAFTTNIDLVESLGAALTKSQSNFKPATAVSPFNDCTLLPEDAWTAAEFVVLTIEAERKDMLRHVEFIIAERTTPELWLLPFSGEPALNTLAG